jgi:hypothetical protein
LHAFKVSARIALRLGERSKQHDVCVRTRARERQRESGSVAAVVSQAAEYLCLESRESAGEVFGERMETSFGGGLHQEQGRRLIIAGGKAINLSHLFG